MRVELLIAPGCSSRDETEKVLREVLSDLAPEATLRTIVVDSPEKAAKLKFPGSPTVRINGGDIESEANGTLNYGLG